MKIKPIGCPPRRRISRAELLPQNPVNTLPRTPDGRRAVVEPTILPAIVDPANPAEPVAVESYLPGTNPYDKAVQRGLFTYAEAKQREEAALVGERIKQAQIATEQAQIALDKEKLELQEKKGDLIATADYIARQEIVIGTFQELLRLTISEVMLAVPAGQRELMEQKVSEKTRAAMEAIGECVGSMKARDVVIQTMLEAFKNA